MCVYVCIMICTQGGYLTAFNIHRSASPAEDTRSHSQLFPRVFGQEGYLRACRKYCSASLAEGTRSPYQHFPACSDSRAIDKPMDQQNTNRFHPSHSEYRIWILLLHTHTQSLYPHECSHSHPISSFSKKKNLRLQTLNLDLLCNASKQFSRRMFSLPPISSNFPSVSTRHFD
jgi:hypothetical protein